MGFTEPDALRRPTGIIDAVTPLQLSRLIADAAADKKARGIVRLDIRQKSSIADYFVICEGDTDRQVRAITDSIIEAGRAKGVRPLRTAGYEEGSWVVLDYASVIVHVFLPGERSYYDLESLWKAPSKTGVVASTENGSKKVPAKRRAAGSKDRPDRPSRRRVRSA
jgi:ribosome-associated protein